jgi:hypothetical protein
MALGVFMGFTKWRVRQGPGTHYLMDGGILDVPQKDTDAFMLEYLACLRRGEKVYVVEQKTEVFRFFVDLDWRDADPISDDRLLEILQVMCTVVPGRCIVARAPPRLEEDGRTKSGVHIHWPDTKVRRPEALAFRTRILLELGDDPEWNERIDVSVYGGSGLRMIGSHKMPIGEPYVPWTPGEAPSPITIDDIKAFSIRTEETDVTTNVTEVTNFGPIEAYIRKYIPGQEFARVKRIGRKSPQCLWIQTDSRWCANIQADHKSNHVWFYVYGDTICQRCHDEDTCKGFVGKEYILSPSIVEELTSNVAVDRSTFVSIRDLVPAHWFPEDPSAPVRERAVPVLGAGPRRVAGVQRKRPGVRGGRGSGRGRSSAVRRDGEHP